MKPIYNTLIFSRETLEEFASYKNTVCTARISSRTKIASPAQQPFRNSTILVAESGSLEISIGCRKYSLKAPFCLSVTGGQEITEASISDNFSGWALVISEEVASSFIKRFYPFQTMTFEQLRAISPIHPLNDNRKQEFVCEIKALHHTLLGKDNVMFRNIVMGQIYLILCNLTDLQLKSISIDITSGGSKTDRVTLLVFKLFSLLSQNVDTHYDINYYARMLCVSKEQLALSVKRTLATTISDIIAHLRIEKACTLLNDPTLSIKQVSDQLSFSNQAAFGKFFKKHKGISPREYRKVSSDNLFHF